MHILKNLLTENTGNPLFPKSKQGSMKLMKLYNKGLKTITEKGIVAEHQKKLIEGWYEKK